MVAVVDRLRPWLNTVTTAVTITSLPAPLSSGIVATGVARGGARFDNLGNRLLKDKTKGLLHGLLQCCTKYVGISQFGDR